MLPADCLLVLVLLTAGLKPLLLLLLGAGLKLLLLLLLLLGAGLYELALLPPPLLLPLDDGTRTSAAATVAATAWYLLTFEPRCRQC